MPTRSDRYSVSLPKTLNAQESSVFCEYRNADGVTEHSRQYDRVISRFAFFVNTASVYTYWTILDALRVTHNPLALPQPAEPALPYALPRQAILRRDYRRRSVRYPFLLYTLHHGSDPLHHRGELARGYTRGVCRQVLVGVPAQHGFLEPLLTRRVRVATTHACAYAHTHTRTHRRE
jgi:hypothetical protein